MAFNGIRGAKNLFSKIYRDSIVENFLVNMRTEKSNPKVYFPVRGEDLKVVGLELTAVGNSWPFFTEQNMFFKNQSRQLCREFSDESNNTKMI